MRRLALLVLSLSIILAVAAGGYALTVGKNVSDPLSSPGTLNKAHYKLENKVNNCGVCHRSAWRGITNQSCTQCHDKADFAKKLVSAATIFHQTVDLSKLDCTNCHTEHKGFTAKITIGFEHEKIPGIKTLSCVTCHSQEKEKHLTVNNNSYNGDCASCHNNKSWKPAKFKHALLDDNQLTNCSSCHNREQAAHLDKNGGNQYNAQCSACHSVQEWKTVIFSHDRLAAGELSKCISCHTKDNKVHLGAKGENAFGENCGSCHKTQQWKPAAINVESVLTRPDGSCAACHAAQIPDKHVEQYGSSCSACHKSSRWLEVSVQHDAAKTNCTQCHSKPASSVHNNANAQCSSCHYTGRWQPVKFSHESVNSGVSCFSCHNRQAAVHGGVYGTDCAQCHRTTTWKLPTFSHPQGSLSCSSCHKPPLTANHQAVSSNCSSCHSTVSWKPTQFDHLQITVSQTCTSCHATERTYHLEQYTINANCQECHSTRTWKPAQFSHESVQGQTCTACHSEPKVSYHRGLGSSCQDCHNTKAWRPARFNHEPYGPIPESHTQTCTSCHM